MVTFRQKGFCQLLLFTTMVIRLTGCVAQQLDSTRPTNSSSVVAQISPDQLSVSFQNAIFSSTSQSQGETSATQTQLHPLSVDESVPTNTPSLSNSGQLSRDRLQLTSQILISSSEVSVHAWEATAPSETGELQLTHTEMLDDIVSSGILSLQQATDLNSFLFDSSISESNVVHSSTDQTSSKSRSADLLTYPARLNTTEDINLQSSIIDITTAPSDTKIVQTPTAYETRTVNLSVASWPASTLSISQISRTQDIIDSSVENTTAIFPSSVGFILPSPSDISANTVEETTQSNIFTLASSQRLLGPSIDGIDRSLVHDSEVQSTYSSTLFNTTASNGLGPTVVSEHKSQTSSIIRSAQRSQSSPFTDVMSVYNATEYQVDTNVSPSDVFTTLPSIVLNITELPVSKMSTPPLRETRVSVIPQTTRLQLTTDVISSRVHLNTSSGTTPLLSMDYATESLSPGIHPQFNFTSSLNSIAAQSIPRHTPSTEITQYTSSSTSTTPVFSTNVGMSSLSYVHMTKVFNDSSYNVSLLPGETMVDTPSLSLSSEWTMTDTPLINKTFSWMPSSPYIGVESAAILESEPAVLDMSSEPSSIDFKPSLLSTMHSDTGSSIEFSFTTISINSTLLTAGETQSMQFSNVSTSAHFTPKIVSTDDVLTTEQTFTSDIGSSVPSTVFLPSLLLINASYSTTAHSFISNGTSTSYYAATSIPGDLTSSILSTDESISAPFFATPSINLSISSTESTISALDISDGATSGVSTTVSSATITPQVTDRDVSTEMYSSTDVRSAEESVISNSTIDALHSATAFTAETQTRPELSTTGVESQSKPEISSYIVQETSPSKAISSTAAFISSVTPTTANTTSFLPPTSTVRSTDKHTTQKQTLSSTTPPTTTTTPPPPTTTTTTTIKSITTEPLFTQSYKIRFKGDCKILLSRDAFVGEFLKTCIVELSKVLKINQNSIKPLDIRCGSVILYMRLINVTSPEVGKHLEHLVRSGRLVVPIIVEDNILLTFLATDVSIVIPPTTTSSRDVASEPLEQVDIVVIIVAGCICGLLILIGLVVCLKECYKRKYAQSFNLLDSPSMNLKLEDFTLTRIPRSSSVYTEEGVRMHVFTELTAPDTPKSNGHAKKSENGNCVSDVQLHVSSRSDGMLVGVTGISTPKACYKRQRESPTPSTSDSTHAMNNSLENLMYEHDRGPGGSLNPIYDDDGDDADNVGAKMKSRAVS